MDVEHLYLIYKGGVSLAALAKRVGKDPQTLRSHFRKNGLPLKSLSEANRKYAIVEDFFDKIDSQEKAYFLGILMADGYNNTSRGAVDLTLTEADKGILETLTALLQPDKPLNFVDQRSNRAAGWKTKDSYRLNIANQHISHQLAKLGCVKAKTLGLIFPSNAVVPDKLVHHFVRGYFDGDGSVCNYKHGKYPKTTVSVTATEGFLGGLQKVMLRDLSFQPIKLICRFPERNNGVTALNYSGRIKCMTFRDWLYADSVIHLDRKKQVFYAI